MKIVNLKQKLTLPCVLGACDGIITVLILIANRLVKSNETITLSFAVRISVVALITGMFVYFISQYTELRRQLLHAEHELGLTISGRLAMTNLGRQIIFESFLLTVIGSIAAFLGAFIPIIIAIIVQQYKWASILSAAIILGLLGIVLAKLTYGNKVRWVLALIISGLLVAYIGMQLNIIG